MTTEREIELQQELKTKNEHIKRVQSQFRDVSLQYLSASIRFKYGSWLQTFIILWLSAKIIFEF